MAITRDLARAVSGSRTRGSRRRPASPGATFWTGECSPPTPVERHRTRAHRVRQASVTQKARLQGFERLFFTHSKKYHNILKYRKYTSLGKSWRFAYLEELKRGRGDNDYMYIIWVAYIYLALFKIFMWPLSSDVYSFLGWTCFKLAPKIQKSTLHSFH